MHRLNWIGIRGKRSEGTVRNVRRASQLTVCLAALLTFAGASLAHAQVLYGTLTGTVTDANNAVVANANVTALNVQTGVSTETKTDSAGIYRIATLQQGTYKVTIAAQGFNTQETPDVPVGFNEVARVDAVLKVGSTSQNVTVNTEAPLLQTDKADVHTDLTAQDIEGLPIMGTQGRNFQELLRTVPGTGLTAETNSLAGNPQRAINANVNGQSNQGSNTRIDGAQDAYPWLPANVAYVPPADAIETVNVTTNSYDAEQGMAGGAAINVQIKSGTNKFHGTAHEFYTSQLFAARDYFQTDITRFPKKNVNIQHQYGGTFGGPIKKDKLFFFGDYERTTQRQAAGPDTRTLPTSAMMSGDFRGLPGSPIIYDPRTGDNQGNSKQQISCNGVLNTICPGQFDPASVYMMKLIQPLIAQEVATSNDLNNWSGSSTAYFNRDDMDVKINYVPTQKSTVFGRYSFSKTLVFDPPLLGPAVGDATNGGQLGNAPGLIQSVGLGATYTFTPNLLLDWNFGFTRQRLGSTFDLTSARGLNDLHIPGTNNAGAPGDPSLYYGYPGFTIGGLNLGNAQNANPFLFRDQQFVTGANLSWNHGKHAFRGGVEWNHSQLNHFQPQGGSGPRGAFTFSGSVTTLKGSTATWFNQWADFLLGLPTTSGKARALFNPTALRWSQYAAYVQDHWQATPNLTLTLGVRWEYYPFGYSDNGNGLRYFDLATGQVLIGGSGSVPVNDGIDTGHGQFLARVGGAYRLTQTLVVRAGYGMSADPNNWRYFRNSYPANVLDNNVISNGYAIPVASLTGLNGTGLGNGGITAPYSVPTGIVLSAIPNLSSGSIPLPQGTATTTIPNPFNRGYINSFNVMVEQEWKNFTFQTGYAGSLAIRPLLNMNANPSPPGTGSAGGVLSVAYTKLGLCSPCNYSGGINELIPFKSNYYNSLQTKVTKRFADGSSAGLSWTWSRATNWEDNEELNSVFIPYAGAFNKNYGPASFDRTHNIEIFGVLGLPFGKKERWLTSGPGSWIAGGWLIDPLVTWMSGVPFSVTASGNLNANGSSQPADLVGHYRKVGGRPPRTGVTCAHDDMSCHYFDPRAFAAPIINPNDPTTAHFGNTNRDEFRGPSYFSADLSVLRDFNIMEKATLEVRADAFSLTNTPHFANPGTGCPALAYSTTQTAEYTCDTGNPPSNPASGDTGFGVITNGAQPGGFFGPDHGARTLWFGATVRF